MPSLLQRLTERSGKEQDRCLYVPQTTSELTGELAWLREFPQTVPPFTYKFREFGSVTALSILEATDAGIKDEKFDFQELAILLTPFDLNRLESYANNMLLPIVFNLFFQRRLGDEMRLTAMQGSILLGLGLQRKTIEDVESFDEYNRRSSIYLSRFSHYSSRSSEKPPIGRSISKRRLLALKIEAASTALDKLPEVASSMKERERQMLDSLDLKRYAIDDAIADWSLAEAEAQVSNNLKCGNRSSGLKGDSMVVSHVKATTATAAAAGEQRNLEKLEESMDNGGKDKKKPTRGNSKKAKH
ncbi:hypothetical protein BYT27DRAFT_7252369 [Phlegmacium glaucopus]|nr:hypothetical protein BYT27DRAFT_7252369 [Phlegmacium glaucopus]